MDIFGQNNEVEQQPSGSFLGGIGSFLWTAIKFVLAAALLLTGIAFFNRKTGNWIDEQTGTKLGSMITDAGDKTKAWVQEKWNQITGQEAPKPRSTEQASEDHLRTAATAAAVVPGVAVVVSVPSALKAVAESGEYVGVQVAKHLPSSTKLAEATKSVLSKATGPVREIPRDLSTLVKVFRGIPQPATLAVDGKMAQQLAEAVAVAEKSLPNIPLATKELGGFAKIWGRFGATVSPAWRLVSKWIAPVGAAVGLYEDGKHVLDLREKKQYRSEKLQVVGSSVEAISALGGIVSLTIGSTIKEGIRAADQLLDERGDANITRSVIGQAVDKVPGFVQAQDGLAEFIAKNSLRPNEWNFDKKAQDKAIAKRTEERIRNMGPEQREKLEQVRIAMLQSGQWHGNDDNTRALMLMQQGDIGEIRHDLANAAKKKPDPKTVKSSDKAT